MNKPKRKYASSWIDYVWIIYFIILFSFNVGRNNMQAISTILLFAANVCYSLTDKGKIKTKKFTKKECIVWYGPFFIFVAISFFWSNQSGLNVSNCIKTLIQECFFLICVDYYANSKSRVRKLISYLCAALFIFALIALVTSSPSTYGSLEFGHFTGQQRNMTGYLLMMASFFFVFFYRISRRKIMIGGASICIVTSLLTGSRKIIVGYAIAIIIFVLLQKSARKSLRYLLVVIVGLAIVIPLTYQIPYIKETFGTRLLAIFDSSIQDGSNMARERARELAKILFLESPIIGNGWNAVQGSYATYWDRATSIYAHNNYLEIAADFGIVGLILYYTKFVVVYCNVAKKIRKSKYYNLIFICLSVMFILDWGQITYCYLYAIAIFSVLFKMYQYGDCYVQ